LLKYKVGQKLMESRGKPVVVENRGGGSTVIGTDRVAKARADGYSRQCGFTSASCTRAAGYKLIF
jgi:tripartite-type tricarboxylate transporter receptor subunit TctC